MRLITKAALALTGGARDRRMQFRSGHALRGAALVELRGAHRTLRFKHAGGGQRHPDTQPHAVAHPSPHADGADGH